MSPRPALALLAGALLPALAAAQESTRIDTVVSVGRDAAVDLSLISGNITVTAWNRPDVQVRGYSERLPLRFQHTGNAVRVWVPNGNYGRRSGDQRLEVVVPAGARVVAGTVSGDVNVRGVKGELEASTVSGDVEARDAVRRVALNTVSGAVRGTNLQGDVRANSVSGEVLLEDVSGNELSAESVSGEVTVRDATMRRVKLNSVSGEVTYEGALARDGRYDFNSHSGEIHLAIPADAAASLSLNTFSGSIDTQLPLTTGGAGGARDDDDDRRGPRQRRREFTLNGGGARVVAETFSGSITITRAGSRR